MWDFGKSSFSVFEQIAACLLYRDEKFFFFLYSNISKIEINSKEMKKFSDVEKAVLSGGQLYNCLIS